MSARAAGCLGCLGAVGLVLAGIAGVVFLEGVRRLPRPQPPPGPAASPSPAAGFQRLVDRGKYDLRYGFRDHDGRAREVRCTVARAEHERELDSYGYDWDEVTRRLDERLQAVADEERERLGLGDHVSITFHGRGGYRWQTHPGGETPRLEARRRWERWLRDELPAITRRTEDELLRERGLFLRDDKLRIDYVQLAVAGSARLADCAAAVERAGHAPGDRQALSRLMAFLQDLRYEVPPPRVGSRQTLGYWVPTEVLVGGHGDCDSKSVAFCALWRHRLARALVVTVPGHALVAVEARPGPGERHVRLGNRYFVLCEVAGPGKSRPGRTDVSGDFEYYEVPPG